MGYGFQNAIFLFDGLPQCSTQDVGGGFILVETSQAGTLDQTGFGTLLAGAITLRGFAVTIGVLLQNGVVGVQQLTL